MHNHLKSPWIIGIYYLKAQSKNDECREMRKSLMMCWRIFSLPNPVCWDAPKMHCKAYTIIIVTDVLVPNRCQAISTTMLSLLWLHIKIVHITHIKYTWYYNHQTNNAWERSGGCQPVCCFVVDGFCILKQLTPYANVLDWIPWFTYAVIDYSLQVVWL